MDMLSLINMSKFFSGFTEEEKNIFAKNDSFVFEHFSDGEYILREGDNSDSSLYVLVKGTVWVTKKHDPTRAISFIEEGDVFGEASFLSQQPRTANVVASGNATVCKIDKKAMEKMSCSLQLKINQQLVDMLLYRLSVLENDRLS
ncbi:MAG: cyclic nucleotide-binding domain-containing protein [Magnetococcales bacterium]|nr:cyclic nucleotide-binding domain-containing protein [Magnetococcales bacterium]